MDPATRLEVDALLRDLWEGVDFEVALARTKLVVRLKTYDEEYDPPIEAQIDGAVAHVMGMIMEHAKADAILVKADFGDKPYLAIGLDALAEILDEVQEYPDDE